MTRRAGTSVGYVIDDGPDGCWLWTGAVANGYGRVVTLERPRRLAPAHRYVWELHRGPVPPGMVLDHLCHRPDECAGGVTCPHRRCVNPWHLEPVTRRQNAAPDRTSHPLAFRGGRCRRGHDLTAPGAILPPRPSQSRGAGRRCAACAAEAKAGLA